MEKMTVKDIVRENKKNTEVFGVFMSERIIRPDGSAGPCLRQFLADERLEGRYPLLGNGPIYDPLREEAIVVVPRKWGVATPDELVGALVGVRVIGTIPVAEDDPSAGEILIIRFTEPDGTAPADYVLAGRHVTETDVKLGWGTWVDYPPGVPSAFPAEEEPDSTPDPVPDADDDEGYW